MNAQQSTIRYAACSFFQDFVTPNLDTYTGTKHVPATFAVEASDFRVHGSSGFEEMIVICCHGRSCRTRDSSWYSDIWCCTRVHTKAFGEYRCTLKSKLKVVISDGMSRQAVDPTNDVIPRKINQFVTWFSSWINLCDQMFHRFWTIKLHVMYLLDPHFRNSWDNICRMIFDVKDFTLHLRILSSSKGWRWFWTRLWGKNGPKNTGRVFTKVAKGGARNEHN